MTRWGGFPKTWWTGPRRLLSRLARRRRGAILLETMIAVFVFGIVGTAVLAGYSNTSRFGQATEVQSVFENIARNQMEYMFTLPYQAPPSTYPSIAVPETYTVTCLAQEYVVGNSNVEKVVVTVTFGGIAQVVLETLRTR